MGIMHLADGFVLYGGASFFMVYLKVIFMYVNVHIKLCEFIGAPFFIVYSKSYVHVDSGVCRHSLLHGVFEGRIYVCICI